MTQNRKHHRLDAVGVMTHTPKYSAEELIRIMQDLAERKKGVRVTRERFRNETQIFDRHWVTHFGTFPAFLEAASLETSTGSRKIINQIARHSRSDVFDKVSQDRLSWGSQYVRPENNQRFKTILIGSDFHDVEIDPFAERMFVEAARQIQPDVVCINGDLFDLPEFSRHPKDPREWDVVGRINRGLSTIAAIRDAAPDSQIDLIEGNHEARLLKFLIDNDQPMMALLADLHGMDIRKLLKLDVYEVNYHAMADLTAFTDAALRKAVMSSEKIYWGTLLARHHPPAGKTNVWMPGFNGHHHQHHVDTFWTHNYGSFEWHQTGGMHRRLASYTEGRKWNCGFLYAVVDTQYQRVNFDYVMVGDTGCQMGGRFYERAEEEYFPALVAELERKF